MGLTDTCSPQSARRLAPQVANWGCPDASVLGPALLLRRQVAAMPIVGGNPARLMRHRYSEKDIARLLALAWWDWQPQQITDHIRTIMSGSIDDLEAGPKASVAPSRSAAQETRSRVNLPQRAGGAGEAGRHGLEFADTGPFWRRLASLPRSSPYQSSGVRPLGKSWLGKSRRPPGPPSLLFLDVRAATRPGTTMATARSGEVGAAPSLW